MPGLIHDVDVSAQIKEQLPEFIRADSGQNFQGFLEAYYEWLELVRIDLDRDVSELFFVDQLVFGERSAAKGLIKAIINEGRTIYVQYKSRQKMLYDERIFTEGLSWDDLVEQHKDRFDVGFWSKSPGADYTAGIKDVSYNAILAASYMMDLQDVDTTDLKFFNETYRDTLLANFPELENARYVNERQLAKMIRTFNNRKGVDKTLQWLFKLVYGEDIDVFFPGTLLLRASDGRWRAPIVTFLAGIPNGFTLSDFTGLRIRGKTSGVEALVINSYKNQVKNKEVNVLELSGLPDWVDETSPGVPGNPTLFDFLVGETIEVLPATFIEDEDFADRPERNLTAEVRGGVSEVEIYAAGSHYSPGQTVTFESAGGVTSTADIIRVSNNFAIDFMGVEKQGTGYQVGDEVEVFPAYTGGKNQKAIVGVLADEYVMYHSYQQIYPYIGFNLNANSIFQYNTREALATALYFTITIPQVFANGDSNYQNGTSFPDYPLIKGQNISFTHSGGTENAFVLAQEEGKNSMLRVRMYDTTHADPSGIKSLHPIHSINSFTLEDGTVVERVDDATYGGSVTANVQFKDMRIEDAAVYTDEIFGGIQSITVISTGVEFFDLPSALVKGRSNTAVYPTWTANTQEEVDYGGDGGKYTVSAYNTMQITTDESTMVFANGWSPTDPDYPISRVAAMETVRTTSIPGGLKTYVHGNAAFGEIRAELVGVLDRSSISYFTQEDWTLAADDTFYVMMEDDPDEEDRMLAEGDSLVLKVLFEEDVADPFLANQTLRVIDANGTLLLSFDGILIEDFRKQGTDGVINVPYLATNSIFQMLVRDPGSDFSQDFLPASDVITFGALNANLIPILSGTIKYEGEWKGYNGILSSPQVLQDSYYWQDFSYSIRSGFELSTYRDLVKRLLHVAGEQLFGEMIITINVNAQMFSGGDYGAKHDINYLLDANSHTNGPFGGPFLDRPFFNLEKEFLYTAANGAVAPFAISPWQANTEDQYADLDARLYNLQILHEPILHDGLFYANGQPVTWVITPGKTYNNPELTAQMPRFITENAILRPEGLLMEDQFQTTGPDYIYGEFPDAIAYKQFQHGARVDWKEFRYLRDLGEIKWIDESLNDYRGGYYYQVPDDSAEGAWYRIDLEGNNLLTEEDKHDLITEDSAQDLTFLPETYYGLTANSVTIVATQSNSSDLIVNGGDFSSDPITGVSVGQKFDIEFDAFEPHYQHSGYSFLIDDGVDDLAVAVESAYEEFRGQMLPAAVFSSPFSHEVFVFSPPLPFSYLWFQNGYASADAAGFNPATPSGVNYYIEKDTGEIGIYRLDYMLTPDRFVVTYISGDIINGGSLRRGDINTFEGRVNLKDASNNLLNRANFTAEINEIGLVNPSIENLTVVSGGNPSFEVPSVYTFTHEGSSNYNVARVSGPVLDWGGPSDIYGGGIHNAIIRQTVPQVLEFDGFDFLAETLITIQTSNTTASALSYPQNWFIPQTPSAPLMTVDVFPGYNYGEFTIDGVTHIADVRLRDVTSISTPGIMMFVDFNSISPGQWLRVGLSDSSSMYGVGFGMYLGKTADTIFIKNMGFATTPWGDTNFNIGSGSSPTYVYTVEDSLIESVPLANPAVYSMTPLGLNRHEAVYVAGHKIDFGGPTDRFNSGFETTISYYEGAEAAKTVRIKDNAGVDYTGPEIEKIIISDIVPHKFTGTSNGIMTVSSNIDGPGNFYRFDNMNGAGFNIGEIVCIKGTLIDGKQLDFKAEISSLGSLTVKLPETTFIPGGIFSGDHQYRNVTASLFAIQPANTGSLDHLNTDFVYSEYKVTPTGTNNQYTVTHLGGAVLNFGGDNNVYDQFVGNAIYLDGDANVATYNFTHYGPFEATMTDTNPPQFHIEEELSGSFITRNASFYRQEIQMTFGGEISAPFYLKIEDTTPGAVWNPINFDYPYWALDGRIYAEMQNEIDFDLPIDVTTQNFYNPLFDKERHPSDYDGTVYRDWRDNPTTIPEPYRVRYDRVIADLPDFNSFVFFAEQQNQDPTGNLQIVFEDDGNMLSEEFSADWQQAGANGSVHTHRDWFAFSEPTIVYHNNDFINTQIPSVLHISGSTQPEIYPTLNLYATPSMNVEIEIRGHGNPLVPTEYHYLPVHVAADEGWLNPEVVKPINMEMFILNDLGDFNVEIGEIIAIPTAVEIDILMVISATSTAVKLPLGRQCGLLIQETASVASSQMLYERLIMTPPEYHSTYYPDFVTTSAEKIGIDIGYNTTGELLITESSEQKVANTDVIGNFSSRMVTESQGFQLEYLAIEDECGDIPVEYHKEIYCFYDASTTFSVFTPTHSPQLEYNMQANVQFSVHPEAVEIEYHHSQSMPDTLAYVAGEQRVIDHTLIPYGLETESGGWHCLLDDNPNSAVTFEDNGYILNEEIPESIRNLVYNWDLVDRQFSEYNQEGSDLRRDTRGWSVIQDYPAYELDFGDIQPMNLTPVMWEPNRKPAQNVPYYFYTEDGNFLVYEDGDHINDEQARWWMPQTFPRHIEIELYLEVPPPYIAPPDRADVLLIDLTSIVVYSEPQLEMSDPIFYDASVTVSREIHNHLVPFNAGTIWWNFPQSPVYRSYSKDSDLREILDGGTPADVDGFAPKDIGACVVTSLHERSLTFEFIVEYNTATIYSYYEPILYMPEQDLIVRESHEWEEEFYLFVPRQQIITHSQYHRQNEFELDVQLPIDASTIVLPIHEVHDPILVGNLIGGSEFAEPEHEFHLGIVYAWTIATSDLGENVIHWDLTSFITPQITVSLDLSFESLIFDYDIVGCADVFPYSVTDRGPNYYGVTPYETIWTPIGDTALVHRRNDTNGLRINTYDSYPLAKQQDSDISAANNEWTVTAMFNIETFQSLDGHNRGNQDSNNWDPMWIWSQANDNEGPGFRFGINNRFMVFTYGDPDGANTFITRLEIDPTDTVPYNWPNRYRTRLDKWYSITISYNGRHCGAGINEFRTDDPETGWIEGTDDPLNNQFRFYLSELESGETTELSSSAHPLTVNTVTTAVPEGFTVGASGPETLRSSSNTGSFSTFYEHGMKVALVATHNRTLSGREIGGNSYDNRSGFGLDPMGWKSLEESSFVYVDDANNIAIEGVRDPNLKRVTANTTQIWTFGNGRNDGFMQQSIKGIYSSVPNNFLVDSTIMNSHALFLSGANTTHFTVGKPSGLGKDTPDFSNQFALFAGDVSTIEIDYIDPFLVPPQPISVNGAYTFAGNTTSLKTEYDFTYAGVTIDVTNLVPFQFAPFEITPVIQFNITATGDQFNGGTSALNNSNSQIITSIDYDWSIHSTDIRSHVIDVEKHVLQLNEIPLTTEIFELYANTITADLGGSILSDVGIPPDTGDIANLSFLVDATTEGTRHIETSYAVIQYGQGRIFIQGDDVQLHGLLIEEPLQFILAEEDDTPIITEVYDGEGGLATELDEFILAEGTYNTLILDAELGGSPFFITTETGFDLDLELFTGYGDSIIAGYDSLHDFVLTEKYDMVQQDDWLLTQQGHTILSDEPIRATKSEIILDSLSNPRTIADIVFEDFIRFDTHDGVSTLD